MKDKEVLERIGRGDESALDFLYTKYYKIALKIVLKNSGSEIEAQDIFQETVIVFWKKALSSDFVLTSKISTYLYSICNNLWLKELNRKKRTTSDENIEIKDESKLSHDQIEQIKIIRECVASLSSVCQKVLSHYYFDGMSMKQVAEILGFANADTAKTKKYKCKKELDKVVLNKYSASDFMD